MSELNVPTTQRLTLHRGWDLVRQNLFNSWGNALLSIGALGLIYVVLRGTLTWTFTQARWEVIPANLHLLLVGTYPLGSTWRVWLAVVAFGFLIGICGTALRRPADKWVALGDAVAILLQLLDWSSATRAWLAGLALAIAGGALVGRLAPNLKRTLPWLWLAGFIIAIIIIHGWAAEGAWHVVDTNRWGGLMLTLILAASGIALCFPLGVLLALGRRSSLPAVSTVSAAYIELMRGIPLVGVLFMAQLLVPIFLPNIELSNVLRAIIGFTLFEAAYVAENVRGGLQGVPRGQIEAAQAIGLNGATTMALIVLPQALRAVIPANVGQLISLFKDTSLVAILGLLDFLGIGRGISANPKWLGLQAEVFCFAALIYWLFTFSMSGASRRLEARLGVGERD